MLGFRNIVSGVFTPVLAKHSKHFSLEDSLAIGVDRMQRNFGPLKQQVEEWQALQLSTASAKLLIYQAFIEEESGFPKHQSSHASPFRKGNVLGVDSDRAESNGAR